MGTEFMRDINVINTSDENKKNQSKETSLEIDTKAQSLSVINDDKNQEETFAVRNQIKKKQITLEENMAMISCESEVLEIKQKHNRQGEDKGLIDDCLMKHFFMRSLEKQSRLEIIKEMSLAYIQENTIIFKQGMPGNFFYIIKTGTCELIIDEEKKKTFTIGESFGELALLHGSFRSGTVISKTECYLWVLERKNFRKIVDHITKTHFEENKTFIQSIPILSNIDHYQQTILCVSLYKETFEEGTSIVKQGEQSNCIFIVKEGQVNIMQQGTVIRTLKEGENFGERSVLLDSTRTMDVIAKTNCVCYSISLATLKNMIGEKFRTILYLNFVKSSFKKSTVFYHFNSYLIDQIFEHFEAINLGKNNVAFEAGYIKSSYIVAIIDGHLINNKTKETIANRGSILFEEELLNNSQETIDYDLYPYPDCLIIRAKTSDVIKTLGASLLETINKSEIINLLLQVHSFKNLPRKKLEIISQKMSFEKYKDGENIIIEGEEGNTFYIIKNGKIDIIVKNKYIRTLNDKEYFGERALFFNEKRSATAKAKGSVEVFSISQDDFISNIESNMKEHLMNRLYLQDNTIELKDLEFLKQLGSGNYGTVSLVRCLKNKFIYAIKGISRKQIDTETLHSNLELERSILLQIDHPFIVKLVKSLKDDRFIYFLMEYINGKELFDTIRDIGLLNKEQTQFYGGSILIAMEYLHERKFIYRDLKPENIIVLYNGYIKIIDFGTAKKIVDRTSTIIGTPHYMAPEVILGEGYSFQVDCWSCAICMFEFICGGVPFGESAEDPMEVYLAIVNSKLAFPPFCKDKEFKQLIIHMLSKNPVNRLTKNNQIKNHVWFQNFNWEELISLNMIPAYIPKLAKDDFPLTAISFAEYAKENYKDWVPKKKENISSEKRKEYDDWFANY